MERRRKFSREFKLEAVKLVTERGVAVTQVAKDLDVHENVLRKSVPELRVASRMIIWTLDEQIRALSVPVLHGLNGRSGSHG